MSELLIGQRESPQPSESHHVLLSSYARLAAGIVVGTAVYGLANLLKNGESSSGDDENEEEDDRAVVDRLQAEGVLNTDQANRALGGIEGRKDD